MPKNVDQELLAINFLCEVSMVFSLLYRYLQSSCTFRGLYDGCFVPRRTTRLSCRLVSQHRGKITKSGILIFSGSSAQDFTQFHKNGEILK